MRDATSLPFRRGLALCLGAFLACLAAARPSPAVEVEAKVVVDTNTAVPGGPFEPESSSTFTTVFGAAADGGRLVFRAWVQDEIGIVLGEGLYSVDVAGGAPEIIADTRTCVMESCSPPDDAFDAFADYSFDGTTVGFDPRWFANGTRDGVWTAIGDTLTLVVRDGDPNPSGGSFGLMSSPAVDGGEIAFAETSFVTENGIFAAPTVGGSPRVVVDGATQVPGGDGVLFDPSSLSNVDYRDGLLVFRGRSEGAGLGTDFLYAEDEGALRVVADSETVAPVLGNSFTSVASYRTDGGDIVFFGQAGSFLDRGIFAERDGALLSTPIWLRDTQDPCDGGRELDSVSSYALGGGAVVFVSDGALYSAHVGSAGLSRLLVQGDTVDGKTVDFLSGGVLHPEAIDGGAVFALLPFTDDSEGIYCLGIPETSSQCSPAPVPQRCLLPEPGEREQLLAAGAGLALLWRRRRGARER